MNNHLVWRIMEKSDSISELCRLFFLIPNLMQLENDLLPHGSYKNRGTCGRFRKILKINKNR